MFFRATKDKKRKKHILFVDALKRFGKGKAQNFLTDEDVEDIFSVYQSKCETDEPTLISHGSLATSCHYPN